MLPLLPLQEPTIEMEARRMLLKSPLSIREEENPCFEQLRWLLSTAACLQIECTLGELKEGNTRQEISLKLCQMGLHTWDLLQQTLIRFRSGSLRTAISLKC